MGITEWTLENGVRVILKPTDFGEDEVLFSAFSPGGTSLVEDDEVVPAITAVDLVVGAGLGAFTFQDLAAKLEGKQETTARPISPAPSRWCHSVSWLTRKRCPGAARSPRTSATARTRRR